VRGWAARTLGEIGPQAAPAIPSLIRLLKDKALEEAAEALRQIDPEAAERAGVK
jgi:HEAT repeat protein